MAQRKVYTLLSINDAMSRQMRVLSREGDDDTYTINVDEGVARLRFTLTQLLKEGKIFQNAVFTTHGNEGKIFFGDEVIYWSTWYQQFYSSGYEQLFPFRHSKMYFAGCNVASGPNGWKFLEAASRTFLRYAGGVAMGWTSLGFGSPFAGHVRHFWGHTRQVMVLPGGSDLRFFENWERIDDGNVRPQ